MRIDTFETDLTESFAPSALEAARGREVVVEAEPQPKEAPPKLAKKAKREKVLVHREVAPGVWVDRYE